jgi:hypothetical protein
VSRRIACVVGWRHASSSASASASASACLAGSWCWAFFLAFRLWFLVGFLGPVCVVRVCRAVMSTGACACGQADVTLKRARATGGRVCASLSRGLVFLSLSCVSLYVQIDENGEHNEHSANEQVKKRKPTLLLLDRVTSRLAALSRRC